MSTGSLLQQAHTSSQLVRYLKVFAPFYLESRLIPHRPPFCIAVQLPAWAQSRAQPGLSQGQPRASPAKSQVWEVVGGRDHGGILVRKKQDVASPQDALAESCRFG